MVDMATGMQNEIFQNEATTLLVGAVPFYPIYAEATEQTCSRQ